MNASSSSYVRTTPFVAEAELPSAAAAMECGTWAQPNQEGWRGERAESRQCCRAGEGVAQIFLAVLIDTLW